mmetsp:Transcript_33888/g.84457  ORF Transcript_33888/g.84457 Transcript_33888/m.84457 type:complete len:205 (+) Transcript_33888:477-1091(+)
MLPRPPEEVSPPAPSGYRTQAQRAAHPACTCLPPSTPTSRTRATSTARRKMRFWQRSSNAESHSSRGRLVRARRPPSSASSLYCCTRDRGPLLPPPKLWVREPPICWANLRTVKGICQARRRRCGSQERRCRGSGLPPLRRLSQSRPQPTPRPPPSSPPTPAHRSRTQPRAQLPPQQPSLPLKRSTTQVSRAPPSTSFSTRWTG